MAHGHHSSAGVVLVVVAVVQRAPWARRDWAGGGACVPWGLGAGGQQGRSCCRDSEYDGAATQRGMIRTRGCPRGFAATPATLQIPVRSREQVLVSRDPCVHPGLSPSSPPPPRPSIRANVARISHHDQVLEPLWKLLSCRSHWAEVKARLLQVLSIMRRRQHLCPPRQRL